MAGQRIKVKRSAVLSAAELWTQGWNAGKTGEKLPDWVDAILLGFASGRRNAKAIVQRGDGKVKEVSLDAIRYETSDGD